MMHTSSTDVRYNVIVDQRAEHRIHELFRLSIILKGLFALVEMLSGVIIFLIPLRRIVDTVRILTAHELATDPHDFVYTHLAAWAHGLSKGGKTFAAWYLFAHGIIKGLLVLNLLSGKRWAYPASLAVFGAFVVYQLFRDTHTHSSALLLLSLFDILIMWLIAHEWRIMRRAEAPAHC